MSKRELGMKFLGAKPTPKTPAEFADTIPPLAVVDDGLGTARVSATLEQLLKVDRDAFHWTDGTTEEYITRRSITSVTKFLASTPTRIVVSYADGQQDEFTDKRAEDFLEWFKAGLSNP